MSRTTTRGSEANRRRPRRVVIGVVAIVAAAALALALSQLGDGSTRTETTDTTGPCTTTGPTTSLPPTTSSITVAPSSSTTASVPAPSTSATTASPTTPPPSPARATVLRHGPTTRAVVAFTFDAGSDAGATSRILDLLAARDVTASFGLTGCWVDRYPELARRIVTDGHGVINHTQNHRSFTGFSTGTGPLTRDERVAELADAEGTIRTATGVDPRPWFRPPYGDHDDSVMVDVASAGYSYVIMWSIDSLGWKGLPSTDVAARTIAALDPGAIVLMHVGSASTDIDALPAILDAARERGLQPVTITALVDA